MDNRSALNILPNQPVKDALLDIFKNNLQEDISNYSINIESGSSKGDNYIGVIYRAIATHSKHKDEKLSVIIKVPPQNVIRRKQFFARPCFLREALVYDEILPLLMSFQRTKGIVPEENGFFEVPDCFKTLTDDEYEAIFLKDLRVDGFEMFNRLDIIDFHHVKLVMEILAKIHAISLAIKDQDSQKFDQYRLIEDIFTQREDDENLHAYFEELKIRALETLCKSKDEILISKVNEIFAGKSFFDVLKNLLNAKKAEPFSVLCHGDCWNNNVLFKYANKLPIDARLIDWQITRYASPICDLMYYLFSCTTKELRDKHYDEFLNIYYNKLSTFLRELGSNPEEVFPEKCFRDQLKQFGAFGLLMSMMLLPIFTSHAEDIPDLDELSEQLDAGNLDVKESFKSEKSQNIYKKRMRDVIVDMVDLSYI